MRLEQFEYIITIAQCRSLSQAAKELFITQPTLSINLQNIEAELGFPIFSRSYKGVELTPKGQELYEIALRIQQQLENVKRLSREELCGGKLELAAVPVFCNAAMLMLIKQLKETNSALELNIHEIPRGEALPVLVEKKVRMSIGLFMAGEAPQLHQMAAQNQLLVEPLFRDQMFAFLPKNHPLVEEKQIKLKQLEGEQAILLRDNINEFLMEEYVPERILKHCYCFRERDSVLKAVSKGMGYSVLPGLMAMDNIYVNTELVSVVPLAGNSASITLYLAYSACKALTSEENLVKRILVQMCSGFRKKIQQQAHVEISDDAADMNLFY